ncbi:helix-turn-helix transcriptional regulator [bacterium]|nr:helix-turn-helix transcriptional regulator [bacterium]
MQADIDILHHSDFYRVLDFKCRCTDHGTSPREYVQSFSVSFIRKGNFIYNVFRHSYDSYNGKILLTKAGHEHTVTHAHHVPDECTIIQFSQRFYQHLIDHYHLKRHWFFGNSDLHSILLSTDVDLEYLHHQILINKKSGNRLLTDNLIMELVHQIMANLDIKQAISPIGDKLKKHHLVTIERAKEYITNNFSNDISLSAIADYCYVSPFHFSRIFKTFTAHSPYQYLQKVRLKNSEWLLRQTDWSVTDICFASGFNSLEHFITSFKQTYRRSPSRFRQSGK